MIAVYQLLSPYQNNYSYSLLLLSHLFYTLIDKTQAYKHLTTRTSTLHTW